MEIFHRISLERLDKYSILRVNRLTCHSINTKLIDKQQGYYFTTMDIKALLADESEGEDWPMFISIPFYQILGQASTPTPQEKMTLMGWDALPVLDIVCERSMEVSLDNRELGVGATHASVGA